MTAPEAARAMARGVRRALGPGAEMVELPMADGGEGTTEVIVAARGGRLVDVSARDALGRPVRASVGLVAEEIDDDAAGAEASRVAGVLGVMDVASAVGLAQLDPLERDPWVATSHGVGDLLRALLDAGVGRVVVGLGGSATNDGGAGMLESLGAVLRDGAGAVVAARPDRLREVASLDLAGLDPRLGGVEIALACDVTNPLVGPTGATAVFGPQKGVSADDVAELDAALAVWAEALETAVGRSVRSLPGAGAAGGLGAAFLALGARRRAGVEVVAEAVGLEAAVAGADLVLTGEGSIDEQTLAGKVPAGVAAIAARHGVPVLAFGGRVDPGAVALLRRELGLIDVVQITPAGTPLADALSAGPANLEHAVTTTLRTWRSTSRIAAMLEAAGPAPDRGGNVGEVVKESRPRWPKT